MPPSWWGGVATGPDGTHDNDDHHGDHDNDGFPGTVLSGRALEHVGLAPPIVHPDQVVLFDVRHHPTVTG